MSTTAAIQPAPAAGRFISFEGIDGAGKTSHITALADWLRSQGRQPLLTREPGGTPLAERLRELFLQQEMDPLTEALLVFAGRRDHLRCVIAPALAAGAVVLCDRFTDATFAYQGAGRGFDPAVLAQLERWVQQIGPGALPNGTGEVMAAVSPSLLQPELTLWFDLPAPVAAARRAADRAADRLEREDQAFFERVRVGYAERAAAAPQRFVRIEADLPREAVWQQVCQAVQRLLVQAALPEAPREAPREGPRAGR